MREKSFLRRSFKAISSFLIPLFFKREYLKGRWFDQSLAGWLWGWRGVLWQKIFGFNRSIPWPVSPRVLVSKASNIHFDLDDLNNFQSFGIYFQCTDAHIFIGKGSFIAPNVGIITSNHDPLDIDRHLPGKDVVIGEKCWIGMNSVILPGIHLGDRTIVGAGSVVTKSFPEGNCTIAGTPAKVIKNN